MAARGGLARAVLRLRCASGATTAQRVALSVRNETRALAFTPSGSIVRGVWGPCGWCRRVGGLRASAVGTRMVCSAAEMGHMEPAEASEMLAVDDWVPVDVRTVEEYELGHVDGSVNVPVAFSTSQGMQPNPKFVEELERAVPDKSINVVMICKVGMRSQYAAQAAIQAQYVSVYNMTGGFDLWKSQELPWTQ